MHSRTHVGERVELRRRIDNRKRRAQVVLHERKLGVGRVKLLVELHELRYVRRDHAPAMPHPQPDHIEHETPSGRVGGRYPRLAHVTICIQHALVNLSRI